MKLRPRLPRVRLLPIVIFVAVATLSVRVGHLWHDISLAVGAPTEAQAPAAAPAAKPSPPGKGGSKSASKAVDKGDKMPATPAGETSFKPAKFGSEGPALTEQEIAILEKLSKRREALDARARNLDLRANLLNATEKRIEEKLAELKKIKAQIKALLHQHTAEQQAKLKTLVKIYENMKPRDAAAIFEKLDLPIVLDVLQGMRVQKSGPILAKMDPARAQKVTAALAERGRLPKMP